MGRRTATTARRPKTPTKSTKPPVRRRVPGLITRLTLARRVGVDARTVAKWIEIGLPVAVRGRGGRASLYNVADCERWIADHTAPTASGGLDVAQERAKRERAQAKLAEQAYQIKARTLLPAAEVDKAWTAIATAIRAKLVAVPQAYTDRIMRAALGGRDAMHRALDLLVDEVLGELSTPLDGSEPDAHAPAHEDPA